MNIVHTYNRNILRDGTKYREVGKNTQKRYERKKIVDTYVEFEKNISSM